jgi:hypothetical protein
MSGNITTVSFDGKVTPAQVLVSALEQARNIRAVLIVTISESDDGSCNVGVSWSDIPDGRIVTLMGMAAAAQAAIGNTMNERPGHGTAPGGVRGR